MGKRLVRICLGLLLSAALGLAAQNTVYGYDALVEIDSADGCPAGPQPTKM
jgi:hypothetical protein